MDMDNVQDATSTARRDLLGWLILTFRPPTLQATEQFVAVDIADLAQRVVLQPVKLAPLAGELGDPQALLDALSSEYVRLFVNSHNTPVAFLDAASYLAEEGLDAQATVLEGLARSMAGAGLAVSADASCPMDHLSTLLEQLYWSDTAAPTQHEDFVLELLGSWVPKMLRRLEVAQPNAFYRNAGQILAAFLGLDVSIEDPPIFHVTESTNGLGNRTQENS